MRKTTRVEIAETITKTSFGLFRWTSRTTADDMLFTLATPAKAKVTLETWVGTSLIRDTANVTLDLRIVWRTFTDYMRGISRVMLSISDGIVFPRISHRPFPLTYPSCVLRVNDAPVATFADVRVYEHGQVHELALSNMSYTSYLVFTAAWLEAPGTIWNL